MQYVQNLFPALAGRQQAEKANWYAVHAESSEIYARETRNLSAIYGQRIQAMNVDSRNKTVLRDWSRRRSMTQQQINAENSQAAWSSLERQTNRSTVEGMQLAEAAAKGISGGLAAQINAAQQYRLENIDGMAKDQDNARKLNQAATMQSLNEAMFSNLSVAPLSRAGLDYTQTKETRYKKGSVLKAAVKDVARLVATYYGGTQATQMIDSFENYEGKYQARNATMQSALDGVYGGKVQLRTASRPEFSQFVAAANGSNGMSWGQAMQGALQNTKQGNNDGFSGSQLFQFGQMAQQMWSKQGQSSGPQVYGASNRMAQGGFSLGGMTSKGGQSGGFNWQSVFSFFGK